MQTLLVALILAAVVGAVFLIARRGYWGHAQRLSDKAHGISESLFRFSHNNPNALAVTREAEENWGR